MFEGAPEILGMMTALLALGLVVLLVLMTTSFIKVAVVLLILRNALGIQQVPPNIVLYAIALALTAFICGPMFMDMADIVTTTGLDLNQVDDWFVALERIQAPVKSFMMNLTEDDDRAAFFAAAQDVWPDRRIVAASDDDITILIPTFMMSELRRAFEIGFLIYLPFVTIDLIVTTILMAMGMMQVQPAIIATPCKLILFVTVSGWSIIVEGLLISYQGAY